MVKRYVFGNPIETEAVIEKPEASHGRIANLKRTKTGFTFEMDASDIVYGLGENVRGMNKRGWKYISNCTDDPNHTPDKNSLYGAHNFVVISGEKHNFGLFVDAPGKVTFDIGYTTGNIFEISLEEQNFELYVISEKTPAAVVSEFRKLIGQSYIAPRWALGYGQSRWGYMSSEDIREVAAEYKKMGMPIDMIYLDIDYMERYKDFTVNSETFADFDALVSEMKAEGIHLIPIIDGGVKVEKGYDVYEEGLSKGYFCKDEDGKEFVVGVWPGDCLFPDFLNEEAGRWFGDKYKILTDRGIDGFWNDMNEPAIFYSKKNLERVFDYLDSLKGVNLDLQKFWEFKGIVGGTANNPVDYAGFYHEYKGQKIRHDRVHNLFGFNMTKSAAEALRRISPKERKLLFSRASYIGMHRFGGIWTGDNHAWWSHLLMNLKMLPSLNMCGFLYTGADLGGFNADTTEDLMARWLALGIFTPLMRNHSAMGTRNQELYRFSNSSLLGELVKLRYRLLPYIYSEYVKAALDNTMFASPLGFIWEKDETARRTEDQLMIGESIMIAPVYEQNALGRIVYLPEEMKLVRFKGCEIAEEKLLPAGHHFINIALDEVVIYLRKGHVLPLAKAEDARELTSGKPIDINKFTLIDYEGNGYDLYNDDGVSRNITKDNIQRIS